MGNNNNNKNSQSVKVVVNVGDKYTTPRKKKRAPRKQQQAEPQAELADVPLIATPAPQRPLNMSRAYRPRPQPYPMASQVTITNSSGLPIPSYFQTPYTNIESSINSHRDAMRQELEDIKNELATQATNAQHLANIQSAVTNLANTYASNLANSVTSTAQPSSMASNGSSSPSDPSGGGGGMPMSYASQLYSYMDEDSQTHPMSSTTDHKPTIKPPSQGSVLNPIQEGSEGASSSMAEVVPQQPPTVHSVASSSSAQDSKVTKIKELEEGISASQSLAKNIRRQIKQASSEDEKELFKAQLKTINQNIRNYKKEWERLHEPLYDFSDMQSVLNSIEGSSASAAQIPYPQFIDNDSLGSSKSSYTRAK